MEFLKALANPLRLAIVELLVGQELCQCDIGKYLDGPQSVISTYLNQLVRTGILVMRRDGTRKLYRIADPAIVDIIARLRELTRQRTVRGQGQTETQ